MKSVMHCRKSCRSDYSKDIESGSFTSSSPSGDEPVDINIKGKKLILKQSDSKTFHSASPMNTSDEDSQNIFSGKCKRSTESSKSNRKVM